jgi:phospholipase C
MEASLSSPLETFDYVVVLMLENRSFDNILGYLYRDGVPAGSKFEGMVGKELSNPAINGTPIPVSANAEVHQPNPDPGEEFHHVTMQPFSAPQASGIPAMKGFVTDYYGTLQALRRAVPPWTGSAADQSVQIMRCFAPTTLPVLSELAKSFAVFDHWFCAVPSQTWCNRAFWHAATSWGWVNNPSVSTPGNPWGLDNWARSSAGPTLFNLLEKRFGAGAWRVYSDLPVPFTKLIHWGALKDKLGETYLRYLQGGFHFGKNFIDDCAAGDLPRYSFLEPHFINFFEDAPWHDDMHPSSFGSPIYANGGPGTVLLGDRLIWKVYQAIRNSKNPRGNNWWNTLLVITFDEHGGCFDHVPPGDAIAPDSTTFNTGSGEEGFDFKRLGVRVPMVMVSSHVAANRIVNATMDHCSFLKTMRQKWSLESLGPRQDAATPFTEVFASSSRSLDSWPDFPTYPGGEVSLDFNMIRGIDLGAMPLNVLQGSILAAMQEFYTEDLPQTTLPTTVKDALELLDRAKYLRFPKE